MATLLAVGMYRGMWRIAVVLKVSSRPCAGVAAGILDMYSLVPAGGGSTVRLCVRPLTWRRME